MQQGRLRAGTAYVARSEQGTELSFLIEQTVGAGWLGVVHRARLAVDGEPTSRVVAVKELSINAPELRGRFFTEGGLRFEDVPGGEPPYRFVAEALFFGAVFGDGDSRIDIFVSEWISGVDCRTQMEPRIPLKEDEACRVIAGVATALHVAHTNNLIHRDLKPANVFLTSEGGLKVTDFGVSCFQSKDRLVSHGIASHTVFYLSPEQVHEVSGVDCSSDIFSLGVMAYELLTGRRPFQGELVGDVFLAIVSSSPPPVNEVVPSVSADTASLVQRMLAKDPAARPNSMAQIVAALPVAPSWAFHGSIRGFGRCPQCRTSVRRDDRFCRTCGRDLRTQCSSCTGELRLTWDHCPGCGLPITRVAARPSLIGLRGGFQGKTIHLDELSSFGGTVHIGRHPDCDLCFMDHDRYVSRHQARLWFSDRRWWCEGGNWVVDGPTTNGTFINGVNVDGRGPVVLRPGDRIRMGDSFFRFDE